jgi:hypothetical protein
MIRKDRHVSCQAQAFARAKHRRDRNRPQERLHSPCHGRRNDPTGIADQASFRRPSEMPNALRCVLRLTLSDDGIDVARRPSPGCWRAARNMTNDVEFLSAVRPAGVAASDRSFRGRPTVNTSSRLATAAFSALVSAALLAAWRLRDSGLLTPEEGAGYGFGVAGSLLMALLLLYPLRKRARFMRRTGAMRHWFRVHMALGILGPACILVHCNFASGAINSNVALGAMLIVTASGIVGRYIYARVHDGLYGSRSDLVRLSLALSASRHRLSAIESLTPAVNARLLKMAEGLDSHPAGVWAGVRQCLAATVATLCVGVELDARLLRASWVEETLLGKVRKCLSGRATVHAYLRHIRRVAGFAFFERVFALWHMLHIPLFVLLVATAVVHVVAVHRY